MIETIEWVACSERLPDDYLNVLIHAPNDDEPIWLGYVDGECWRTVEGIPLPEGHVVDWAEMPAGPHG